MACSEKISSNLMHDTSVSCIYISDRSTTWCLWIVSPYWAANLIWPARYDGGSSSATCDITYAHHIHGGAGLYGGPSWASNDFSQNVIHVYIYTWSSVTLTNMTTSLWLIISPHKVAITLSCYMLSARLYLAAVSVFVFPCNQRRSKAYPLAVPNWCLTSSLSWTVHHQTVSFQAL